MCTAHATAVPAHVVACVCMRVSLFLLLTVCTWVLFIDRSTFSSVGATHAVLNGTASGGLLSHVEYIL